MVKESAYEMDKGDENAPGPANVGKGAKVHAKQENRHGNKVPTNKSYISVKEPGMSGKDFRVPDNPEYQPKKRDKEYKTLAELSSDDTFDPSGKFSGTISRTTSNNKASRKRRHKPVRKKPWYKKKPWCFICCCIVQEEQPAIGHSRESTTKQRDSTAKQRTPDDEKHKKDQDNRKEQDDKNIAKEDAQIANQVLDV